MTKHESVVLSSSRREFLVACVCASCASLLPGCATFSAFQRDKVKVDEGAARKAARDVVDELRRVAELPTYQKKKPTVCFLGVSGGGNSAEISAATRDILSEGNFRLVEKSATTAAFKESGVRANNVFIPTERKKFIDALGEDVDFLLAGYIERTNPDEDSEGSEAKKGRSVVYKLELVDVESNQKSVFTADL